MSNKEFIVIRESLLESILADLVLMWTICFLFWFNYKFIGWSYIVNTIIILMLMSTLSRYYSTKKRIFTSKEEVIKFLDENK